MDESMLRTVHVALQGTDVNCGHLGCIHDSGSVVEATSFRHVSSAGPARPTRKWREPGSLRTAIPLPLKPVGARRSCNGPQRLTIVGRGLPR